MSEKKLSDLLPGDSVYYVGGYSAPLEKYKVKRTTKTQVIIEYSNGVEARFWKKDGKGVGTTNKGSFSMRPEICAPTENLDVKYKKHQYKRTIKHMIKVINLNIPDDMTELEGIIKILKPIYDNHKNDKKSE